MARALLLLCAAVCVFATAVAAADDFSELNTPVSNAIYSPATVAVKVSSDDKHGYYRKSSSHKKHGYKSHEDKYSKDHKEYKPKEHEHKEYKPKPSPSPTPTPPPKGYTGPAPKDGYYPDGETYEKDGYYLKDGYYYKEPEYYEDKYSKYGSEEYEYKHEYDNYKVDYDSYGKPNFFPKICIQEIPNTRRVEGPPIADVISGASRRTEVEFQIACCKPTSEESPEDYEEYYKKYGSYGIEGSIVPGGPGRSPPAPKPIGRCEFEIERKLSVGKSLHHHASRLNVTVKGHCTIEEEDAKKCFPFGHFEDDEEVKIKIDDGFLFAIPVGLEKEEGDYDYYSKYPYVLTASKTQIAANLAAKAAIASTNSAPEYDEEEKYYSESGEEYEPAPYPHGGVERGFALVVHAHIEKCEQGPGIDKHESKHAGHGMIEFILETIDDDCLIIEGGVKGAPSGLTDCKSHGPVPMVKVGNGKLKISKKHDDYGYGYEGKPKYEGKPPAKKEYKPKGEKYEKKA